MLKNETFSKLYEMHMGTMVAYFTARHNDPQYRELSFEERFSILVDAKWATRKSNRLSRLIKNAGYAIPHACVENISFLPERKLDKEQILSLAFCSHIEETHNVLILGATGVGKTYFACALGVAANRNFYTVKYVRLPDILTEISLVRGDGTYREVMRKYKKVKLLILDKWLLYPLKENEASICWN